MADRIRIIPTRPKQAWLLKQHLPRGTKLRITDVKELFHQMKDHV